MTLSVYKVLRETVEYIPVNISPDIYKIHYFSVGQTMGNHSVMGFGGIVKRATAKASLLQHLDNQITSATQMFEYCVEK